MKRHLTEILVDRKAVVPDELIEETEEISRLEQAAQKSDDPIAMQREAEAETKRPLFAREDKLWLGIFGGLLALSLGVQWLLHWKSDWLSAAAADRAHNYLRGSALIVLVLTGARIIEILLINRLRNAVSRFNLKRIFRLVVGLVVTFILISVLFANWYTAVVSLGLISLILGFALQTPISSFVGWVYILARAPYRVGDRIKIGSSRGDVIDVSYLDTTLWEFGGDYLSGDHPSGRIIKFPNSQVFSNAVINYSWPLFPYIWSEIRLNIAYESDLDFVAATMQRIAEEELGNSMVKKVHLYRDILARTPVSDLEVGDKPVVLFRVSDNTWLVAILRYLVMPRESGHVKTRLIKRLLKELNRAGEKVLFPKSNAR
jgi:small-conductance mechanosensitive channel